MVENVKVKVEELRTKVRSRVEEIRGAGLLRGGGGSSGILSNPGILQGRPILTELREKGLMATAKERVEKIRAGGRLLGGGGGGGGGEIASSPRVDVSTDTGVKVQKGRLAIEA